MGLLLSNPPPEYTPLSVGQEASLLVAYAPAGSLRLATPTGVSVYSVC